MWGPSRAVLFGMALSPVAAAADFQVRPSAPIELAPGESAIHRVRVDVTPTRPVVDVYLLADTTGSMQPALDALQDGAQAIVAGLKGSFHDIDLNFGVGEYRDFPHDEAAFRHMVAPTAELGHVEQAIAGWKAHGGFDGPEAQLWALDHLARDVDPAGGWIGWRPEAQRIVVWFGDAPAHDPVCAAISGAERDVDEAGVISTLQSGEITVLALSTTTGLAGGLDGAPAQPWAWKGACPETGTAGQATRIAAATGGRHVEDVAPAALVPTITALVRDRVGRVEQVALKPSGSAVQLVRTIEPATRGPVDVSSRGTVTFDVTLTAPKDCAASPVSGNLDVFADGTLVGWQPLTLRIRGCDGAAAGD